MPNQQIDIHRIFFPLATDELEKAKTSSLRFAHYTSASVATSILKNREVWMRKPYVMNDASEIRHGAELWSRNWNSDQGSRLRAALDLAHPDVSAEAAHSMDRWVNQSQHDTYITCLSKHDVAEDRTGRLSMWRAYGGSMGVAIVFNGAAFFREDDTLGVYSSPIAYLDEEGFGREFSRVVNGVVESVDVLKTISREDLLNYTKNMLIFGVLCTKNPGFKEEQEWRVLYEPKLWPSPFVKSSVEIIRDRPQKVWKVPLDGGSERKLDWLNLDHLIERVIVGPGPDQDVTGEAMYEILKEQGVTNPAQRVILSEIPLR